jgi:DNA gyrase inhibitor GyrI
VAAVAGFSPFHFHRVFRSLVGETLGQFVTWLPSSGHEPTDQPCFEAWLGRPFAGAERDHF